MVFIETSVFAKQVAYLLSDDEYRVMQWHLVEHPTAGDVIQGTGGIRKLRWAASGKGKSGGVRVIYFHVAAVSQVRLLVVYRKGVKDDLTPAEKTWLRSIVDKW